MGRDRYPKAEGSENKAEAPGDWGADRAWRHEGLRQNRGRSVRYRQRDRAEESERIIRPIGGERPAPLRQPFYKMSIAWCEVMAAMKHEPNSAAIVLKS